MTRGGPAPVVVLSRDGVEVAVWPLPRDRRLDLGVVDDLARLQLAAGRHGCRIRLRGTCAALRELLELVGLLETLAPDEV